MTIEAFRDSLWENLVFKASDLQMDLFPTDTVLIFQEIVKNGVVDLEYSPKGSVLWFVGGYPVWGMTLKAWVSGEVKEKHPKDLNPGFPVILKSFKIISECPIPYLSSEGVYPLQNTSWSFMGFVDDTGEIYSYPSCELAQTQVTFSNSLVSESQIYFSNEPGALFIQFKNFLGNRFIREFPVYKLESNQIKLFAAGPTRYLSPGQIMAGYAPLFSSIYTMNKNDSLKKIFNPGDNLEYSLRGNKLILSNSSSKIKALFVSE
jgi:hypothetical protein